MAVVWHLGVALKDVIQDVVEVDIIKVHAVFFRVMAMV